MCCAVTADVDGNFVGGLFVGQMQKDPRAHLPDNIKTRIKHLGFSCKIRKQFVLYQQLGTLVTCADWCANANGREWYAKVRCAFNHAQCWSVLVLLAQS